MSFAGGFIVFLMVWWMIFFMALPLRVERQKNPEKGNEVGAPENPHLKFKFILTTVLSILIWGGIYLLSKTGILTYELWR